MRVKIWYSLIIISLVIIVISCDTVDENLEINAEDYYGDGSFFIALARLNSPDISENYCGIPKLFELRDKRTLDDYGTVTIYGDGLHLNFQFDLLPIRFGEGWGIERTLIWIGQKDDWISGEGGPTAGWGEIPGINIASYPSYPNNGIHKILLEEWMFESCLVVAARVVVRNKEMVGVSADGFINHGDYLTYMWNEPFCLEECIDPGTQYVSYWENNPEIWTKGVTIGGVFYSEDLAIQIMKGISTADDMSNVLFEELVSTKLNVDLGNTSYCIIDAIEAADAWMEENGPVGSGILSDHPAWDTGNSLASQLESYNSGLMCADPAN